jgi:transposase-like protein
VVEDRGPAASTVDGHLSAMYGHYGLPWSVSRRMSSRCRTSEERRRIRGLERENRELPRAKEILKAAAAFFGAELDRPPRR